MELGGQACIADIECAFNALCIMLIQYILFYQVFVFQECSDKPFPFEQYSIFCISIFQYSLVKAQSTQRSIFLLKENIPGHSHFLGWKCSLAYILFDIKYKIVELLKKLISLRAKQGILRRSTPGKWLKNNW